jgi:hypothetical protein
VDDVLQLHLANQGVHTDCHEFVGSLARHSIGPDKENQVFGFIRVQSVSDANSYAGLTRLNLTGDRKQIELGGWNVTFTRLSAGSASPLASSNAIILPEQTPMSNLVGADRFRTALVILPEVNGIHQYIVTVPESFTFSDGQHKYAILFTREWQVLFLRDPIPPLESTNMTTSSDCGCND